jgi:diphthamide biosynthesis methyltransferase
VELATKKKKKKGIGAPLSLSVVNSANLGIGDPIVGSDHMVELATQGIGVPLSLSVVNSAN